MIARWHQCGTMTSQMLARASFFRRLFDRLPVRISTSDLHHRITRKKLYHIRAYDFGVQFSFKVVIAIIFSVCVCVCVCVHMCVCYLSAPALPAAARAALQAAHGRSTPEPTPTKRKRTRQLVAGSSPPASPLPGSAKRRRV